MRVVSTGALALGLLTCASFGCKTADSSQSALRSDDGDGLESQAQVLANEYDGMYGELAAAWVMPFDAEGLALADAAGTTKTSPLTFDKVSSKLASVESHLAFIDRELANPKSEYHMALKAKNVDMDDALERALVVNCGKAKDYVAASRVLVAKSESLGKFFNKDLANLPGPLAKKVEESYQLVDLWDSELAALELAIRGKEALREGSSQIQGFFKSLAK